VDTCGNESDMSSFQKTIYLTTSMGLNGSINLVWSKYEGFHVQQYNIWRGSDLTSMSLIESVPENIESFTDFDSLAGTYIYQLEAVSSHSCNPDTLEKTFNSSFSSLPGVTPDGINNSTRISPLSIFPNPFNEFTTLNFNNPEGYNYKLYLMDLSGKVCRIEVGITTSEFVLEKGDLMEGFYFVELRGPEIYRGKIIIE
jgi:hypothetical protein